jgi:23S rRNA pseudouridine2605 synthase
VGRREGGRLRLQKYLADAGIASRRDAEELIRAGRVLLNDEVVTELPAFVDPTCDRVVVDGALVRAQKLEYWVLHKPPGYVLATRDPQGRRRIVDLLPETGARLLPVGRMDAESSGLLVMTNDHELAERLASPRSGVPHVYHVEVKGRAPHELAARMRAGVYLSEGKARASAVQIQHAGNDRSAVLVTLREEYPRQVRRMLAKLGFPVKKLKRVEFGPLDLKGTPVGAIRRLSRREVDDLRELVAQAERRQRRHRGRRPAATSAARPAEHEAARPPEDNGPRRRLIT